MQGSEVYHLWAHATQSEARAGHCSFTGNDARSYGAVIGRRVTNARGEVAYLFNTYSYSVTTAKHQSWCFGAVPRSETIFRVSGLRTPQEMLDSIFQDAAEIVNKAKRARKYAATYQAQAMERVQEGIRFAAFYDLPVPEAFGGVDLAADLNSFAQKLQEAQEEARLEREEQARLQREKYERDNAERLEKWLAGQNVNGYFHLPYARMRIQGDVIETTMGASAPLADVARHRDAILRMVRMVTRSHVAMQVPQSLGVRFGRYAAERIEANGDLIVGCHKFQAAELERIGAQIVPTRQPEGSFLLMQERARLSMQRAVQTQ